MKLKTRLLILLLTFIKDWYQHSDFTLHRRERDKEIDDLMALIKKEDEDVPRLEDDKRCIVKKSETKDKK